MHEFTPVSKQNPNSLVWLRKQRNIAELGTVFSLTLSLLCILIGSHIHAMICKADWFKITILRKQGAMHSDSLLQGSNSQTEQLECSHTVT